MVVLLGEWAGEAGGVLVLDRLENDDERQTDCSRGDRRSGLSTRPLLVMGGWVLGDTRHGFWMGVGRRVGTHLHT